MSAAPAQQVGEQSFICDACGRKFRWKAELAGRKARCKCGGVIDIPLRPPTMHRAYVDPTIVVTPGDPLAPTDLLTGNRPPPQGVDSQVESPQAQAPAAASSVSPTARDEPDTDSEGGGKGAIGTIIAGLIFVGVGVWQLLDPHDPSDTSGGRRRLLRTVLGWVYSIAGNTGVVVLLVGLGLLLIGAGVYSLRGKMRST
jgi:hypothetical protein